jgi:Spy/CpxP family protein refolding chaperone
MLRRKMLSGMVLLFLVISPVMAKAKGMPAGEEIPPGKWWHDPEVSKELNLSEAEQAKLDEAFRDSRRKLIKLKSAVEGERFELGNLLEKEVLDEAALMQQFKKLEEARTELARERFGFLIEVRKILGHKRFLRIKEQRGEFRRHGTHRRTEPAGPPGPGGMK